MFWLCSSSVHSSPYFAIVPALVHCSISYQSYNACFSSADCSLAWYKTPTTLFVENPVFGYSHQHIMKVFEGSSVQRLFLNSFEQDSDSSGIPFEIWTRSYFPNVRDCLLFKVRIIFHVLKLKQACLNFRVVLSSMVCSYFLFL